jgi:hypothetical protein
MKDFNARDAVFTPPETSTLGVERIRQMEANKHRAMPLALRDIGEYVAPLMPGEICAIQAQTSNYKSGFMAWWERNLAQHLAKTGRDEVIIHVDTENVIESLAIQEISYSSNHSVADLSRGNVRDWGKVIRAAGEIAGIQIYRVATSLGHDRAPDLYLSNIYRGIQYMVSGQLVDKPIKPACIFVDYLQALPIDPEVKAGTEMKNQRRLQVREDVYRLRRMAAYFDCPIVVGVQAKQVLTGHAGENMRIPGTYDGEETSSIAQRFDRILSLWMPKTTHTVGDSLRYGGIEFEVEEDLLFLKVNKQRGGLPAGKSWKCRIDFKTNTVRKV